MLSDKAARLLATAVLSGALVLSALVLVFAGRFLDYSQKPDHADAIIVLSGGRGRLKEGLALYRHGYAKHIILSNSEEFVHKDAPEYFREPSRYGTPLPAMIMENKAESTYQNAVYTKKLMRKFGFASAIVVSSNYHMRRVKYNFDKVYGGSSIRLIFCAAPSRFYHPSRWWSNGKSILYTFQEYLKFAGNALGMQGSAAKWWMGYRNGNNPAGEG